MGLDFWIEVPENVTLTKGRNNVIADHYPAVLESSYKAFETLFLDNILTDSRILNHSSNILFESIAQIFNESYQKADAMIEAEESKKYSTRRKMMASLAKFGSKTADLCSTIGESIGKLKDETGKAIKAAGLGVGKGIYYIGKGMFYTFPRSLGEFIRESTSSNPNPEWQARMQAARARARQISSAFLRKSWDIAKGTVIYTGCGLSVVATGVGSYLGASQLGKIAWKLYEKYGNQGLVYCAEAIGAAGLGYLAYRKIKSSGITLKGIAR
jgi:hypothetical protein